MQILNDCDYDLTDFSIFRMVHHHNTIFHEKKNQICNNIYSLIYVLDATRISGLVGIILPFDD